MGNVYLDGIFVGRYEDAEELRDELVERRRNGDLDTQINLSYAEDKDELRVLTDSNRVRRPLAVVEDGKVLLTDEHIEKINNRELTIDDLVEEGVVEYILHL